MNKKWKILISTYGLLGLSVLLYFNAGSYTALEKHQGRALEGFELEIVDRAFSIYQDLTQKSIDSSHGIFFMSSKDLGKGNINLEDSLAFTATLQRPVNALIWVDPFFNIMAYAHPSWLMVVYEDEAIDIFQFSGIPKVNGLDIRKDENQIKNFSQISGLFKTFEENGEIGFTTAIEKISSDVNRNLKRVKFFNYPNSPEKRIIPDDTDCPEGFVEDVRPKAVGSTQSMVDPLDNDSYFDFKGEGKNFLEIQERAKYSPNLQSTSSDQFLFTLRSFWEYLGPRDRFSLYLAGHGDTFYNYKIAKGDPGSSNYRDQELRGVVGTPRAAEGWRVLKPTIEIAGHCINFRDSSSSAANGKSCFAIELSKILSGFGEICEAEVIDVSCHSGTLTVRPGINPPDNSANLPAGVTIFTSSFKEHYALGLGSLGTNGVGLRTLFGVFFQRFLSGGLPTDPEFPDDKSEPEYTAAFKAASEILSQAENEGEMEVEIDKKLPFGGIRFEPPNKFYINNPVVQELDATYKFPDRSRLMPRRLSGPRKTCRQNVKVCVPQDVAQRNQDRYAGADDEESFVSTPPTAEESLEEAELIEAK